jgi:hypothetical protein
MIPSPKIAVIDDEPKAIKAICRSLEKMDTSCLPVLVEAGVPSVSAPIKGIRLLFLDIHLVTGVTEGAALYETNASILERVISPDNGPYVLVVWTTDKHQRSALLSYISSHYPSIPRPLASLLMAKEEYLEDDDSFNMVKVREDIARLLEEQKEASALLYWENAIDLACGELLGKLTGFIPREEIFLGNGGAKLARLLGAIAQAAVGVDNVPGKQLSAINEGLMPLLFDRLTHLPDADGSLAAKWSAAIGSPADPIELNAQEKADLHLMYHFAQGATSKHRGAIYELPEKFDLRKLMPGQDIDTLFRGYFTPEKKVDEHLAALKSATRWCLVVLRAACDQAQPKPAMNRLLLAARITGDLPKGVQAKGAAIYQSPVCSHGEASGCFQLIFNFHFLVTLSDHEIDSLDVSPEWRLRDALCTDIETKFGAHASRPGIITMR